MAKVISPRTIAVVVLGVLALRSIDVRGIEKASDIGNVAGMMSLLTIPIILVLAMLGLLFWPRVRTGKVEPDVAKPAQGESAMVDQMFTVVLVECRYCKTEQKVHVAVRTGAAQVGDQLIQCIKCKKDFAVTVMDKIIGGPFAA
jgi:hypothetical protein